MKKITLWVDNEVDALSITAISTKIKGCRINTMAFDITKTNEIIISESESGDD